MDIEKTQEILEKLAEELPVEFYKYLNGGILLLPDVKLSPYAEAKDLYIMGQYVRSPSMGCMIKIFHGSIEKCYSHLSAQAYEDKLREILRHEFRHHMEGLSSSGEGLLEKEDREKLLRYKEMHNKRQLGSKG